MKYSELQNALGIKDSSVKNNQIQISSRTLTENIGELIEYCYDNQTVVIDNVKVVSEKNEVIVITNTENNGGPWVKKV